MLSKISRSLTQAQKVSLHSRIWLFCSPFSALSSNLLETSATRVSELRTLPIQGKYCNETLYLHEELTQPKLLNPILMTLYFWLCRVQTKEQFMQFSKEPIMKNFGELPFGEIPEPLKYVRPFSKYIWPHLFNLADPCWWNQFLIFNNNNYRLHHSF